MLAKGDRAEIAGLTSTSSNPLVIDGTLTIDSYESGQNSYAGTGTLVIGPQAQAVFSATYLAGVKLINKGSVTVEPAYRVDIGMCMYLNASLENAGKLTLVAGGTIYDNDCTNPTSPPGKIINESGATIATDGSHENVSITGGVLNYGALDVDAGDTLELPASTIKPGSSVAGGGVVVMDSGTIGSGVVYSGSPVLELERSTHLTSSVTFTGVSVQIYGLLIGNVTVTFPSGSNTLFSSVDLDAVHVVNRGHLTVQSSYYQSLGICMLDASSVENAGSMLLSGGAGIYNATCDDPEAKSSDGIINLPGATINTDGSHIPVQVQTRLINEGTLEIQSGDSVQVTNFQASKSSTLKIRVSESKTGTVSGHLVDSAAWAITGALSIASTGTARPGPVCTVISDSAVLTGTFSSVSGVRFGAVTWAVNYPTGSVTLTASTAS